MSIAKAREKARGILAEHQLGQDRPKSVKFQEAFDTFREVRRVRERTKRETERLISKHFLPAFRQDDLDEITRQRVVAITDKMLRTPSEARHAHAAIVLFFRWATERGLLANNSLSTLRPPTKVVSRDRVLCDAELAEVFRKAEAAQSTYARIVQLLILTGQRKSQIAHLRSEWIDRNARLIAWPADAMKGAKAHAIPYGSMAAAIIDAVAPSEGLLFPARARETPFNGFAKSKEAFDRQLKGVAPYVIHDFRRVFSSGCASLGVAQHVVERILAHHGGVISGVAAIYNRYTFRDEMREAIERWEAKVASLIITIDQPAISA